ncbi:hypothetical protein OH77DRAFT_496706 [Trametes cingulata]|nr:hypothetical protein OH77DRAFT_496706 [Trametes cingulata]
MADANAIFQNCYYVGNNFNAILYGIELVLYFASISIILSGKDRSRAGNRFFLYFSTGMLLMITIYVAVQAVFGEEMWIVNADYPGGSAQYLADNAAIWYQTLGSAASIVLNLMSDGILVRPPTVNTRPYSHERANLQLYRCFVVWGDIRVIIFPGILYLATAALGILTCYVSGKPNANFFVGEAQQIALAYSTVVIGLNVTASTLICVRILFLTRQMRGALGSDSVKMYTGAAALVIESALPYTLFGIAYVVSLGINSPTSILFLSIYVMFTCISPQMIVLRVLMGRAWSRETATRTRTAMVFTSAPIGDLTDALTSGYATSGYVSGDGTTLNLPTISHISSSQRDLSSDKV